MKKIFASVALLLFILSFTHPASAFYHGRGRGQEVRERVATRVAQRATIQDNLEELRSSSQELREERRMEIRERQATKRAEIATKVAQLRTKVVERIKTVFTTILERLTAALGRMDKIVDRINSRVAKLKDRGVDTARSEAALAACSDEQSAAVGAIGDSKAKVAAIDPASTTVKGAVHTAIAQVRAGKKALKEYHRCLVSVLRTLRASIPKEATESAE